MKKPITLYHGTNEMFEEFSNNFLSTDKSIDQYGSGFYFYSMASKTVLHGYLRVTAKVTINKAISHASNKKLTRDQIETLLLTSPSFDDRILNFGDTEYEGMDKVLKSAVKTYSTLSILDCLNCIGNDFFESGDTHLLLSKFVKLTGIDCITDLSRDIYVILTKKQIEIISCNNADDEDSED